MQRLRNMPKWVDSLWPALLAIYVLAGVSIVPFHGDESTLIFMGRDYYYQFVEGDMSKILYDDTRTISVTEQELRLLNGTIPKYLFGWVTYINGNKLDTINDQWDWGNNYNGNKNQGHIPNDRLLMPARMVSAVQLIFAISLFFVIAQIAFNRPIAYLASLYLTLNSAILINGRRAMMEGSHLLFMMLVLVVGLLLIHHRKWWLFILLGIVSGLAVAAKHPNAIVVALVFIACGSYVLLQALHQIKSINRTTFKIIGGLIVSGLLALVVFYAMNPAWWGDPVNRASEVLHLRNKLLDIQIGSFPTILSPTDNLRVLFKFMFVAQPQYFEVPAWSKFSDITSQIQAYEQSPLSGIAIGGSTIGGVILVILNGLGLPHFARNTNILPEFRWFILVWGIGIVVITYILTPLEWQRYYLPIYPFVGLMTAYSVVTLSNIFWKRIIQ
jgi:4-amino-4-deoxy-L-arabinose transferase-like glycosyltransferase